MAIAVPIGVEGRLVGTGFIAGAKGDQLAVVTALHLLGHGQEFIIGLPPHGGDVSRPQRYPLQGIDARQAALVLVEPLLDVAIFLLQGVQSPVPRFISNPTEIRVGEEVLIVGYPYAVIGSFLETVEPCYISAIGHRIIGDTIRNEFILSHQTYPGSSGSPVIRKTDGTVCGIVRGCLAPPGMIVVGNLPLGTDSNITYSTSAHLIPGLIEQAFKIGGIHK